jgi:hypothetical protein
MVDEKILTPIDYASGKSKKVQIIKGRTATTAMRPFAYHASKLFLAVLWLFSFEIQDLSDMSAMHADTGTVVIPFMVSVV